MKTWNAQQVARAAGAQLLDPSPAAETGPVAVTIDSRQIGSGTLFVGLPGGRTHGGAFAGQALISGAWGVLTDPLHGAAAQAAAAGSPGVVLVADDPLRALQRLATAWRRELGAKVIGVTGSTGKTTTKEILAALLAPHRRVRASRANFNTEIGLPLEILAAPAGTEVLVLEMGMRGPGQIAELAQIAEPDVAVIVSIGPVHLELLGTVERIAAAKAELIAALAPGATAIVPADEPLLGPHRRGDLRTVTFGPTGDVRIIVERGETVEIDAEGQRTVLGVPFPQAHLRRNLLAAVAAARAVGVAPSGTVELELSAGRGRRLTGAAGVTVIDDCYNANPMSVRAALDDLLASAPAGRRVAVLGDMLELGPDAVGFHREIGAYAAGRADILVTVGPLAAQMAAAFEGETHGAVDAAEAAHLSETLVRPGDTVLVKASRGVALEAVVEALCQQGAPA